MRRRSRPRCWVQDVQLRSSDKALCDECWRKKKDPVDKPLFSSDGEGLDETLLTTKSIQTENVEDQSQQEDVPRKGEVEPVGLVGGGNKTKKTKMTDLKIEHRL